MWQEENIIWILVTFNSDACKVNFLAVKNLLYITKKLYNSQSYVKLSYCEKATKFEKILLLVSTFIQSKQVGHFFKCLWPFQKTWKLPAWVYIGDLISKSVSLWLKSPKKLSNLYPEHLFFRWMVLRRVIWHIFFRDLN